MKNQILVFIVTIGCFDAALARRPGGPPMDIIDSKVYRIETKSNSSVVLTSSFSNTKYEDSNHTLVPTTSTWQDDAGQKWRLVESSVYNSFSLHPTNDENFELEYDGTGTYNSHVGAWGFGNNRLWYIVDAGDGYNMIKNQYNEVCLRAGLLRAAVDADKCDNSDEQQWRLVFLSKDL